MISLFPSFFILIVGVCADNGNTALFSPGIDFTNSNTTFSITMSIPHPLGFNISINDTVSRLQCKWGALDTCYVQCDFLNVNKSSSNLTNEQICILTNNSTQLSFYLNDSRSICNVTKCIPHTIMEKIHEISSKSCTAKDLKRLLNVKNMCSVWLNETNIIQKYITAEKKSIHDVITIPFNGTNQDYDLEDLSMTVVKMNTFSNSHVHIAAPQVFNFSLPLHIWIPMEPFLNVSDVQSKVGIVTYESAQQFMNENISISSKVIRIEVVGRDIKNLTNLLYLSFKLNPNTVVPANISAVCQYFDDKAFEWNSNVTSQTYDKISNVVNCSYDHMTPFAVLLIDVKIDPLHWDILSYITYIGCGVSALFSLAAVFLHVMNRVPNTDSSINIHVSLSGALFLLNGSFLLTEVAASWSIEGVCVLIAVTVQYSLLCCFSWMAIEALHLYLLLIKVFNIYIKHYMIKLSLFGWGLPAVLVGASLSVYNIKAFYGTKNVALTDMSRETKICWITDVNFLYGMNVVYFTLTFMLNTAILSSVTLQICKMRRLGAKSSKLPSCKEICTVLGLTCLLGMTWSLAFLSSGYTNYPILYLFCICNSLQGLFMFVWIFGTSRRNKRQAAQRLCPSEPFSSAGQRKTDSTSPEHSHNS